MRCDEVAEALPRLLEGPNRADRHVVRHVESCLRCQAELARYRRMLRLLGQLRAQHPPLPPGALGSVAGGHRGAGRAGGRCAPPCAAVGWRWSGAAAVVAGGDRGDGCPGRRPGPLGAGHAPVVTCPAA